MLKRFPEGKSWGCLSARSDKSCSHESPYPSRTGAAPESPLLAMRPLHAVMREFPPADIFTAQALRTTDPQISCVCVQCARRAAAQVAPDTGPSAHAHSPGPGSCRLTRKRVSCHAQAPIQGGVRLNPLWRTPLRARLARPWPAHAAPRSSALFASRPRSTWVSRRTARQVVKPNVEELRARPAHKDRRSGAGACDAGRPDPQLWCARTHTQAPAHRDACGRLTCNLRSCPNLWLPPRPVLPFNTVSDS
jgi:hypothetical protein